jgi:hypothetical protein
MGTIEVSPSSIARENSMNGMVYPAIGTGTAMMTIQFLPLKIINQPLLDKHIYHHALLHTKISFTVKCLYLIPHPRHHLIFVLRITADLLTKSDPSNLSSNITC